MDFISILRDVSSMIEADDNQDTTGLDIGDITNALSSIMGGNSSNNSMDLTSIVSNLQSDSPVTNIVKSWIGNGSNEHISESSLLELLGENKIEEFANMLGIGKSSAIRTLASAVPEIVDSVTNQDSSIADDMFSIMKKLF